MRGFYSLFYKEVVRFWKVGFQTLLAPLISTLLYLLVFSSVLGKHVEVFKGVGYLPFLVSGLAMMALLQNAFANSSSSLIQSKITGNIIFLLLSPVSYREMFLAYVAASAIRGTLVGFGIFLLTFWAVSIPIVHPLWAFAFSLCGCVIMGAMGIVAGMWAEKFDQLASFQNFIVLPMTFLSGVFYSIDSLPPFWKEVSKLNPFFYLMDGFRYGLFGVSESDPAKGLFVVSICLAVVSFLSLGLLKSGYKLRN